MKYSLNKSVEPVKAADTTSILPEFGRTPDVTRLFGIRRGTLYNLSADGKIRGVTLRVRGTKSGVRLWDLASVRDFIRAEMCGQAGSPNSHGKPGEVRP